VNAKRAVVYLLTSPGGKGYVGVTRRPLAHRIAQHGWEGRGRRKIGIHGAFRKYGRANISGRVLLVGTWDYCLAMEPRAIEALRTRAPLGYNMTSGGEGVCDLSADSKERIAASQRGRKCPQYCKDAVSRAQRGRAHTAEHRFAAGSGWRGKKRNPEQFVRGWATRRAAAGVSA
jgi:hypothetical protein